MGREGDLGIYQEVQAENINGNAVVMKACAFVRICVQMCMHVHVRPVCNGRPHIVSFRLFSIFATVIMM